jgi:hypothetical protein
MGDADAASDEHASGVLASGKLLRGATRSVSPI